MSHVLDNGIAKHSYGNGFWQDPGKDSLQKHESHKENGNSSFAQSRGRIAYGSLQRPSLQLKEQGRMGSGGKQRFLDHSSQSHAYRFCSVRSLYFSALSSLTAKDFEYYVLALFEKQAGPRWMGVYRLILRTEHIKAVGGRGGIVLDSSLYRSHILKCRMINVVKILGSCQGVEVLKRVSGVALKRSWNASAIGMARVSHPVLWMSLFLSYSYARVVLRSDFFGPGGSRALFSPLRKKGISRASTIMNTGT